MQSGDIDGFGARRSGQWKEGFSKTPVGGWPSFSRPSPQPFGDHASLPNYAFDSFDSSSVQGRRSRRPRAPCYWSLR